jgi:GNAT superfamily N-acetyltransferase
MHEPTRIMTGTPQATELPAINAVVEAALTTWDLPGRVRRLVLPIYRYSETDRQHLCFALARAVSDADILGVAAWEPANPRECPAERSGLLLHGLYVAPPHQRRGIGSRLLRTAVEQAAAGGFDGVLVKAQRDAEAYFAAQGLRRLPVDDAGRDYPGRYWRAVGPVDTTAAAPTAPPTRDIARR